MIQNEAANINKQHTFAMISLGCAKNQVDAESMSGLLMDAGYISVGDPADAEIIIVNTCGFIQSAKEEAIETIFEMAEYKQSGICKGLIVSGCLSERHGSEIKEDLPEVDVFLGIGHIDEILEAAQKAVSGERFVLAEKSYSFPKAKRAISTAPRYAYLKIADGCDNCCTYCAIPNIRGSYLSRPIEEIIEEANYLAENGFSEIILIAQDTTRYGTDIYGEPRLIDLLKGISEIKGVRWIRVMYFYPDTATKELIDVMAELPKVCNYIDLPLQHIDDDILKTMNRRGSSDSIKELLKYAREKGEFALRTTFIAGFPGETKEQAEGLLSFIKEYPFDRLGAFAYSREEKTPAADMEGQIKKAVKNSRQNKIMAAQRGISKALLEKRIGREYDVIIEGRNARGKYFGRSMLEAPDVDGCIFVTVDEKNGDNKAIIDIGSYVRVRITGAYDYDLTGVAI